MPYRKCWETYMSRHEERKIAVTRNGKDLLRIIPLNPDDSKVELKFDFSKQMFEVDYLRLGEVRAHRMIPKPEGQLSLTYHKGNLGKEVCVHIRHDVKNSTRPFYEKLPLKYFKAPAGNDISMTPICKVFFPECIQYKEYKKKATHETFSMRDGNNAVEIFIVGPTFDFKKAEDTFPILNFLQLSEDIEFYANGVIETVTGKRESIEKREIQSEKVSLSNEVRVVLISYRDFMYQEHEYTKMTKILFIENEFHEFPLLNRYVCEGDPENFNDKFSQLHSVVEDNILRGINTPWLQDYADDLAKRYYQALNTVIETRKKCFDEIWKRTQEFISIILKIQEDIGLQLHTGMIIPNRENRYLQWFSLPLWYRGFDLHLLLAKYLNRTEVSLVWRTISKIREPNEADMKYIQKQVLLGKELEADQIIENHCSLALPEADIDLLFGEYNKYGGQTNTSVAVVWPTHNYCVGFQQEGIHMVLKNIRSQGFVIGEEQFVEYDRTIFNNMVEARNLDQVWSHIRSYRRRMNNISR